MIDNRPTGRPILDKLLEEACKDHVEMFKALLDSQADAIDSLGLKIVDTLIEGGKILTFGNGGSAADAQHLACELVGRFEHERPGLPAISLSSNAAALTAVGNDYGFDQMFVRGVEALARPGDLCLGISTTGNSMNVVLALRQARELGVATAGLAGGDGGLMREACDNLVIVPHRQTCRIQEAHVFCIHIWCAMVEQRVPR
jgi:D-sedoheptulose 7-phosphate isomerase